MDRDHFWYSTIILLLLGIFKKFLMLLKLTQNRLLYFFIWLTQMISSCLFIPLKLYPSQLTYFRDFKSLYFLTVHSIPRSHRTKTPYVTRDVKLNYFYDYNSFRYIYIELSDWKKIILFKIKKLNFT